MQNTRTIRSLIILAVLLIIAVAAYIWTRGSQMPAYTSPKGYSISIPAGYKVYEDENGMIAFPKLVYADKGKLDYEGSYGANTKGISMTVNKMSGGILDQFFDGITEALPTSTIPLPAGVVEMRSGLITKTPDMQKTPAGAYEGIHYAFRTEHAVYFFNVFSKNDDQADRVALATKIFESFKELK